MMGHICFKNKKSSGGSRYFVLFCFAVLFFPVTSSAEPNAIDIVQKRDDIMRGKTSEGHYKMEIVSPRWTRNLEFNAWSKGTNKSFIEITYPKKDSGTTFLRVDTDLWQYVPSIEKIIKIPPSMMLQSWMGTDFTNDDLVKESSIIDDYTHRLLREENGAYVIESIPKPEAAVVWGKIIQWIDKQNFLPVKDEFYDEDGVLIKHLLYDEINNLQGRPYPMRWQMIPLTEERKGHRTTIVVDHLKLDQPITDDTFSMKALKRYSR